MDAIPSWSQVKLDAASFATLVALIDEACGIKLSDLKRTMVETRLRRRLLANDIPSFSEYVAFLNSAEGRAEEFQAFVDALVTNETSFFREAAHFDHLSATELTRLATSGPDRRIRFWSAASSSGEEAYSIAMTANEASRGGIDWDWSILATDISIRILTAAREGIYSAADITNIPLRLKQRYLVPMQGDGGGDTVRISDDLRRNIRFGQINLMHAEYRPGHMMDVIFCRNVLIYFSPETQTEVVGKLCRHLRPGGLLFLGHSDTLRDKSLPLRLIRNNIYERLKS